jgi:hypothetical protein
MGNQVMRQILPWAGEWLGKYGRMPTIEEYNVKYAEFAKILVAEGEKAAAYQQFIENAVKEARNCKGCKMWRSLSIAGQEPGCSRNLIQVKCPKCTDLVPMPQSPSSLGKCPKCEAQLLRETSVVPYALFCQNYEPDLDAIRQGCLQKGIPAEIVEAVFPTQKEPNATVEEGAAATAPASDPAGDAGR